MTHAYRKLTNPEFALLNTFARNAGRSWKRHLGDLWLMASDRLPPELYALRNSHGPSWLTNFRLNAERKGRSIEDQAITVSRLLGTAQGEVA